MNEKINIKSLDLKALQQFFKEIGEPTYRGKQIFSWIWKKGVDDISCWTDLSKKLRDKIKEHFFVSNLTIKDILKSQDGAVKYLFQRENGQYIESVFIPSDKRRTVCVSTQVGCPLKCTFCATGQIEFKGNLLAWEIADQVLQIAKNLKNSITNVVFMGMGEPLLNWENVKKALFIINSSYGMDIGARRITISTAGIVPGIYKLADLRLQVRLAISLNSAIQTKREKIMPIASTYPLSDLKEAIKSYYQKKHRMVTLEYVLINQFNIQREDFLALKEFARELKVKINLIPLNPHRKVLFLPPEKEEVKRFYQWCLSLPHPVTIRESKGKDVKGACGQLAGTG